MSNTFYIKNSDTSPVLTLALKDSTGTAVDLTGSTVRIHVNDSGLVPAIDAAATVVTAASGVVSYTFDGTIASGHYFYEVEVTYPDSSIETFPNSGYNKLIVGEGLA